ncbi:AAA-domain-containing protein [Gymnopus androsaceus JB14]|uniref:AAA-domain-containing protein n=1 Tax=Gymnopus androsaceus JB14 TaxID=1447944 RepID=A0A6A4IAF7_9AGAR|nr:AAA-domain-containing protein [Gymnopus androsaceus JB14]
MAPKADWEKYEKKADDKEEKIVALDDSDIQILKTYGQGPYARQLKTIENDLNDIQKRINEKLGVKESDTGLASPNLWDLAADRQRMSEEHPLQVARCTKIIPVDPKAAEAAKAVNAMGALQGQKGADEQDKYVINIRQIAKFVVGLGERVAPTDIEEGMRVGVDRNKYQIQIPLPPKIDASVTMMQVEEKPDVTYSDVGGCKEQIEKLREVVETPLLSPERFVKLGIDPPKGVLLFGPPGTGKTLCARAVANRTDATFIRVIGSELVQKYVGEGARMVRELFEMARSKKACIIFFDEVDAIGGARFDDGAGGDNEVQRTMLELINQLDGFDPRGNIKVLMATNRRTRLCSGQGDSTVVSSSHCLITKGEHTSFVSMREGIFRFDLIARLCPNTTGAELRSVATEAGMFAIRARRKVASERDFLDAVEKVVRQGTKFSEHAAIPSVQLDLLCIIVISYFRTKFILFNESTHAIISESGSDVTSIFLLTIMNRKTRLFRESFSLIQPHRNYVRRAPAPSPREVTELLGSYASSPHRPLNLSALLSFGRPLTPDSVLASVAYALEEIPRRLSTRVQSLEALPFIVGTNPYVASTLAAHRESFMWLATYPTPKTLEENAKCAETLEDLVEKHANDIPTLAKGFQECSKYMTSSQMSEFLDGAIRSRISVRLIAEQHISLSRAIQGSKPPNVGVVDTQCSPAEMVRMCGSFVSELCEATLGSSPIVTIEGDREATFAYVPVHLEYILTEIMKNAFRATVEHHNKKNKESGLLPPVLITLSAPPRLPGSSSNYFSIRVRDQGGGVTPANVLQIFSYAFTTAGRGSSGDDGSGGGPYAAQHVGGSAAIGDGGMGEGNLFGEITGKGLQTGLGTIAGLGYFDGSLDLLSLEGWGCDVFLKLRCLDEAGDSKI